MLGGMKVQNWSQPVDKPTQVFRIQLRKSDDKYCAIPFHPSIFKSAPFDVRLILFLF